MELSLIAQRIAKSRSNQNVVNTPIFELTNCDPYSIQKAVTNLLPATGAWKAGGTNKKTQTYFDTDKAYYGPIEKNKIFQGRNLEVNSKALALPLKGELEICFLLPPDVFVNESDLNELVFSGVIKTLVCLELPWTIFEQPASGLAHLIADVCGANALLCGPEISPSILKNGDKIKLSLQTVEGETITSGIVSDSIISPLDVLIDFIEFVKIQEIDVSEPIFLATGGVSACVPLNKNKKYLVKINDAENFNFSLG